MNSPEDTTAHATESESSKNYLTLHLYHLPTLHYVLNVNIHLGYFHSATTYALATLFLPTDGK